MIWKTWPPCRALPMSPPASSAPYWPGTRWKKHWTAREKFDFRIRKNERTCEPSHFLYRDIKNRPAVYQTAGRRAHTEFTQPHCPASAGRAGECFPSRDPPLPADRLRSPLRPAPGGRPAVLPDRRPAHSVPCWPVAGNIHSRVESKSPGKFRFLEPFRGFQIILRLLELGKFRLLLNKFV